MAADPPHRRCRIVADRSRPRLPCRWRGSAAGRSANPRPGDRRSRRSRDAHRGAGASAIRAGPRPDPRRSTDPHRLRAALAVRPAGARPARRPCAGCAARLGIAHVPRAEPCGYDPQVADDPASLSIHPAAALAARWSSYLQHDLRRSAHTVRAYEATAHRFIQFLGRYRGETIDAAALTSISAADLRAFLADRRAGGLGPSSAARELSGVRAFLKYAAEQQGSVAQLPRTRAPKRPRTLPRPAAPDDAVGLAENAAEAASEPWIGARDLAVLLLLYGAGLRVAEALSLTADVLPLGSTLKVTGKRSKTRIVPVVAAVREAIGEYARQCPYPLRGA